MSAGAWDAMLQWEADTCPHCAQRRALTLEYGVQLGPCPLHTAPVTASEPVTMPTISDHRFWLSFSMNRGETQWH